MNKYRTLIIALFGFSFIISACGSDHEDFLSEEESPGVEHPDTAGFRVVTSEELDPPIPGFNFTLTDQNNELVSLEDLHGSVVMMTFIYTHCPEACPIVAANFRQVQNQMSEAIVQKDLILVLITTDPERDTPSRLKRYTQALGGDWYFLTGELETMQEVWDSYDIYWEIRDRTQEIVVFHSYKTYLIDQDGKIRFEFTGVWYPDDITPDIQILLNEGES